MMGSVKATTILTITGHTQSVGAQHPQKRQAAGRIGRVTTMVVRVPAPSLEMLTVPLWSSKTRLRMARPRRLYHHILSPF